MHWPMENGSLALQYLLSGITKGSIYAVVAIGFNLIYSATGVLNFAQGEFVMLGGMVAVTLAHFVPLPVAIVGAVVIVALVGCLLEIAVLPQAAPPFRPAPDHHHHRPLDRHPGSRAAHLGRESALAALLHRQRSLLHPVSRARQFRRRCCGCWAPSRSWWSCCTSFLRYTLPGRAMRACSSNPDAAMLAGINIPNMRTLSFGLSAALGALAGCVISPITMTHYEMGAPLAIKGFAAAILGGLGNPMAAVAGGLLVGVLEAFAVSRLPGGLQRRRRLRHAAAGAVRPPAWLVRPARRRKREGTLTQCKTSVMKMGDEPPF